MNNYEKIMLALFAIQHGAYIIQTCNDELRQSEAGKEDFIKQRCDARDELLAGCLPLLRQVMEDLGECVNAMDAVTGVDAKLMEVPYAIICGGKIPEDYDNE